MRLGRLRQQLVMEALRVLPRRSLSLLPGTSRQFGPPRRWMTFDEYRDRFEADWIEVIPATPCGYPRPEACPALIARLWRDSWPAQGIAVLPSARVLGSEGWPVAERDTLLIDLATGHDRAEYTAFLNTRCTLDEGYGGRALNLASCYARENYCHFLLDALPRLELFHRARLSFSDVDWILVPHFVGSAREPFFEALGLPPEKLLRLAPGRQYQFDLLYQPSFPGRESYVPKWVAEFYRDRVLSVHKVRQTLKRRLYVSRRQRGIENDRAVWHLLAAHGFERVEPTTWDQNVDTFAQASLVVGPHGAGLSNVIFCPPGAHLIEFVPGDRPFPYFYSAASAAGMTYSGLLTSPLLPPGREYQRLPSDAPLYIDLPQLEQALKHAETRVAQAETV